MRSEDYPLVSICIPNYNYGKYLDNCLSSVLSQTYPNIEVLVRDNASTDNSMDIALSYLSAFKNREIFYSVIRNKRNVGSDRNSSLLAGDSEGRYVYFLASDDAIKPDFVSTCVSVFNRYPSVGLVMTNRIEMDEFGKIRETIPFYNKSCIIPGEDQASIFMMSGIAIPGQRMMKRYAKKQLDQYNGIYGVAGDWFANFLYSCTNDIAYVKDSLCIYRVHSGNETSASERNLLGIFEHFRLMNHFHFISDAFDLKKAHDRYGEAVDKLGFMAIRYAEKMIKNKEYCIAQRYLSIAKAFYPSIVDNPRYKILSAALSMAPDRLAEFSDNIQLTVRTVSYDPPESAMEIEV